MMRCRVPHPLLSRRRDRPSPPLTTAFAATLAAAATAALRAAAAASAAAAAVAATLNTTPIGGKKGEYYREDLWNLKYLRHFKWDHLTEKVAYERRVREQKLRLETMQVRRRLPFNLSICSMLLRATAWCVVLAARVRLPSTNSNSLVRFEKRR
jgi:hypothetical protein